MNDLWFFGNKLWMNLLLVPAHEVVFCRFVGVVHAPRAPNRPVKMASFMLISSGILVQDFDLDRFSRVGNGIYSPYV